VPAGLQELVLLNTQVWQLPPALAGAASLTRLVLWGAELALSDAEVDGILLRMPSLRELSFGCTIIKPGVVERLSRSARHLRIT